MLSNQNFYSQPALPIVPIEKKEGMCVIRWKGEARRSKNRWSRLRSRPNLNEPQFTMGRDLLTSCISIQIAVIERGPDRPEIVDRSCQPACHETSCVYRLLSPLPPLFLIYQTSRRHVIFLLSFSLLFFAIIIERRSSRASYRTLASMSIEDPRLQWFP